jgi:Sporulation protein YtrH
MMYVDNEAFVPAFIHSFFIALGVLLGGSLIGAIGAFLVGEPPLTKMFEFANRLKIWALVAAIGGTFDAFYSFERGIFQGETRDIVKQVLLIISAMGGAQTGWQLIKWLTQEYFL